METAAEISAGNGDFESAFVQLLKMHIEVGTCPRAHPRRKRKNLKWSFKELAEEMAGNVDEIKNFEKNLRNWRHGVKPGKEHLEKICEAFFGNDPDLQDAKKEFVTAWRNAESKPQKSSGFGSVISAEPRSVGTFIKETRLQLATKEIRLWLWTSETILPDLRPMLENRGAERQISIRFLVQHPDEMEDTEVQDVARSSIRRASELAASFPMAKLSFRFYPQEPWPRLFDFELESGIHHGLVGMYYARTKGDGRKFIGSEHNDLIACDDDDDFSRRLLARHQSRYERQWLDLEAPPRAVIFDLDGVIIDSMHIYVKAWAEVLEKHGCIYSKSEIRDEVYRREGENRSISAKQLYQAKKGRVPSDEQVDEMADGVTRLYNKYFSYSPVNGLGTLIAQLKTRNVRLGLVTGSHRNSFNVVAQNEPSLFSSFDVVVTGDDTGKGVGKPNPAPYNLAVTKLAAFGVTKENCIVVENAPLGVQSARGAGLSCIGFLAVSPLQPDILIGAGANAVARKVADLRKLLMLVDSNLELEKALQWVGSS